MGSSPGTVAAVFCAFCAFWVLCLNLPPGRREQLSIHRNHLIHACLASLLSVLAVAELAPDLLAICCLVSYFWVDLCNILLNDWLLPTRSKQQPLNRALEYVHHAFMLFAALLAATGGAQICDMRVSPVAYLAINEISTVFLQLFRIYKHPGLGVAFALSFFFARIYLNLVHFTPVFVRSCVPWTIPYVWYPFMAIQFIFFVQIVHKIGGDFLAARKGAKEKNS